VEKIFLKTFKNVKYVTWIKKRKKNV